MPTAVSIPGQGIVSFPDEMDDEAIHRASKKLYLEGQLAATRAERAPVETRVDVLQNIAEPFVYGATPQGLYDTAGRLLKYAGNVTGAAAEDLQTGATVPTPLGPLPALRTLQAARDEPTLPADLGPAQQGLTDVARMAPTLGAGMALQAFGVPTPLAFGGPMGATAYAEAKGHGASEGQALSAAAEATAVGMIVPPTAKAGAEAAARGLGVAVERGLLSGRRTLTHKAVEVLAGNGAVQLLMEGLSLPEYLAASPEERKNLLIRHMTANTAFLALDVPNLLAPTASRTQGRIFANVAEVLGDVAKNPQAMEELLRVSDEEAVNKAAEIEAAKGGEENGLQAQKETQALTPTQGMPPGAQAATPEVRHKTSFLPESKQESEGRSIVDYLPSFSVFDEERRFHVVDPVKLAKLAQDGGLPEISAAGRALMTSLLKENKNHPLRGILLSPDKSADRSGSFTQYSDKREGTILVHLLGSKGNPISISRFARILNHELVHNAVTSKFDSADVETLRRLHRLFKFAKTSASEELQQHNAFKSESEFLSDALSSRKIREYLIGLDYRDRLQMDETPGPLRNKAFGGLLDIVRKVLSLPKTLLDVFSGKQIDAITALDEAVSLSDTLSKVYREAPKTFRLSGDVPEARQSSFFPPESTNPDVPHETSAQGMPPGSQAAIASPLFPNVTKRTQLVRVRRAIQDVAASVGGNLTLISGRFRGAARAIFRPRERVAHFRNLNDLPSVAHEAAHELSAQLWQGMAQAQLPPNVRAELLALGQAAYGAVRPPGGYAEEGWAEFFRHYLTMDDAQAYAPATHDWFTQTVLPAQRRLGGALGVAREQVDRWRQQGLLAQVRAAQTGQPSKVRDAVLKLRRSFGMQGMFEGGLPVRELSRLAAEQAGRPLRPAEDPYQLLKAFRGKAGTMIYQAARVGMVDLWGRPTGGQSLRQALAPVAANRPRDVGVDEWNSRFWDYMYGLQAQEMLARGQNPGISQEQADAVVGSYANPAFDQARSQFRDWNRGILNIVREASPNFARLADAWEQANPNYVPLARETDATVDRRDLAGRPSNPAFRRRGSSRRVREIQSQVLLGTEKLLASALREKTMDAMFELAQNVPGLGRFITRVPRDMVERGINVEQLRDQMEALGVDTTNMPVDTLLTYYQAQERPHGLDPVMVRQTPNGPEWFQVDQRLFDAFSGYSAQAVNFFTDLFLYLPSRVFKLGTTGIRPSFGFTTNVMRDLPTFLSQSASGVNPFGRLSAYFRGMFELSLRALTAGRVESESLRAFERSGVLNATFLGGNISHARREARNLHHGTVMRTFLSPVEAVREAISTFESGPRYAEWRRIGREMGADPAQGLTPDQVIRMTNAAKEVTTDFSARGDWGGDPVIGSLVGGMPFANAALQGARAFARTLRDRPLQALLYGTAVYTLPTLWNWWRNKDDPGYRRLPARERWYYLNVPTKSGQIVQYPKPQEWGSFFSVLPEALFDAAYQSNPKVFTEVFGHIFTTLNPFGLPVLAQETLEQVANKDFFWDRPIVPEYDRMNLQPGEQVAPYTSSFAKGLGRLMPETVSPRRVDHAVRSILGGAWSDAIAVLDLSEQRERRGREPADLPVVGRIFRRGGEYSPRSRSLENLYDLASYWQSRQTSERFPMTAAEDAYAHVIREHMQVVRTAQQLAEMSNKPEFRREVYRRISDLAEQLVNDARKIKMLPEQKHLPAQVEPVPRIKGL